MDGNTALHWVVIGGNDPSKVELLLEHGADVAITNNDGETALDCAREMEKLEELNVNRTLCIELLEKARILIDQSKL
jgi:ankyrin repeat protein